jgi:methylmalonyl-CoA mutase N-terminal domain/subunit
MRWSDGPKRSFLTWTTWAAVPCSKGSMPPSKAGWFCERIADSAHDFEHRVNEGQRVVVGVSAFTDGDDGEHDILYIGGDVEDIQLKRLAEVKRRRDQSAVSAALARVRTDAAEPEVNLLPAVLEAARCYATVGEVMGALGSVFGTWTERASI